MGQAKVLITAAEIQAAVSELGRSLATRYQGMPLTVLGVMSGSVIFLADLIRQMDLPMQMGLVQARSYRGANTSPGPLQLNMEFLPEIAGRHLLLVDDIFDTGQTLAALVNALQAHQPASLSTAVLLLKQGRATVAWRPDYALFEIPDRFVVGYGLDYQDEFRNLPYVGELDASRLPLI